MLAHRIRRWLNIKSALDQRLRYGDELDKYILFVVNGIFITIILYIYPLSAK